MKFTKILLFTIALGLFSCSSEEDVTIDSRSEFHQKNTGLPASQVTFLRNECVKMSVSPQFLSMRQLSKQFAANFKTKNADLSSRDNFQAWISVTANFRQTTFASVSQALAMADEISNRAGLLIAANPALFNGITGAARPQLTTILEPIMITPPVSTVTSSCQEICDNDFNNQVAFEDFHYESMIAAANGSSNPAIKKMTLGFAESGYIYGIDSAISSYDECSKACDNEW